jgi:hypothetical protein
MTENTSVDQVDQNEPIYAEENTKMDIYWGIWLSPSHSDERKTPVGVGVLGLAPAIFHLFVTD